MLTGSRTPHSRHRLNKQSAKVPLGPATNESAKMATSKGVIQGYCGVATVDAKHQIIVDAQAHGTGSEQERLIPVVQAIQP